jgi:hypothetical protein
MRRLFLALRHIRFHLPGHCDGGLARRCFGLDELIAAVVIVGLAATSAVASEEKGPAETCTVAVQRMPTRSGASHALSISLHTFAGSRWSQKEIRAAVVDATGLLAQCGVILSRAELCVVEAPRRFHFYSTPVSRDLLRRLPVSKPAVFFAEDTHNRPAYDAEAIGRGNAAARPELADTVWVAHGALDLPLVLAHELVHVLSDSGEHSEGPDNLMRADTSALATRLTNDQCERLRTRGTANGLLQPVR